MLNWKTMPGYNEGENELARREREALVMTLRKQREEGRKCWNDEEGSIGVIRRA